jgi:serine/threonine-protein kinase
MRPRTSLPAAILVVAAALASAPPAFGQTPAANKAAAEALYQAGQALIKDHKYDDALAKLLASQKLDPGLGTLLNAAYCYEQIGKTASAWALYNEVAGLAKSSDDKQARGEIAAEAARALEPRLSKVVVTVPNESRVASLEVRRDGEVVDPATWGTPIPVDPGTHSFEASAPGRTPWKAAVEIPTGPGTMPVAVPVLALGLPAEADVKPQESFWSTQRSAGVAVCGVGLVGVAVGSAFTAVMRSKNTASLAFCPTSPTLCYAQGVNLRNQAFDASYVATGTFVAGTVLAATGLVVFLTTPKRAASAPPVGLVPVSGRHVAGLALAGAW